MRSISQKTCKILSYKRSTDLYGSGFPYRSRHPLSWKRIQCTLMIHLPLHFDCVNYRNHSLIIVLIGHSYPRHAQFLMWVVWQRCYVTKWCLVSALLWSTNAVHHYDYVWIPSLKNHQFISCHHIDFASIYIYIYIYIICKVSKPASRTSHV